MPRFPLLVLLLSACSDDAVPLETCPLFSDLTAEDCHEVLAGERPDVVLCCRGLANPWPAETTCEALIIDGSFSSCDAEECSNPCTATSALCKAYWQFIHEHTAGCAPPVPCTGACPDGLSTDLNGDPSPGSDYKCLEGLCIYDPEGVPGA